MIYVQRNDILEENFVSLLADTRQAVLSRLNGRIVSPDNFESLAFEGMDYSAKGTEFEGYIERTGDHGFPDIIAKKFFGAEVKMTTGNKWSSTGNSILETTRIPGVERIYLFFGKLGGGADIKYRPYQECLSDVGVTHSPRYKINMNLPAGESIFDKIGTPYDDLRVDKASIQKIKNYYRGLLKEGEELWWIDPLADDQAVSPVIKTFRDLDKETQSEFIIESMILFPEMFGNSISKFERVAAYLITNFNAVHSSLRDIFTAGGQKTVSVRGEQTIVPKIFFTLKEIANEIATHIDRLSAEKLAYYWRLTTVPENRLDYWKNLLNNYPANESGFTAVDIFEAGYEKK